MAGKAGPGEGHNNPPVNGDEDARLVAFFERIDTLDEEKKDIGDAIKDIFTEAKALGYDVKTMRRLRALWKLNPEDRKDRLSRDEQYQRMLGLDLV